MSMELHVAFSGEMPSATEMDSVLSGLDLPYRLAEPTPKLEGWSGYLPFLRGRQTVGVELDVFEGADAVRDVMGGVAPDGAQRLASFRWSGDVDEMGVAFGAAAALASLVGGVVFEPSEGAQLAVDEAATVAREALRAG